ncbi:MAG: hypothetical protein QOH32_824 [Bradyrhizobium sp.]|jgi:septal ring factor EnvC (AmiA/AmiB activator)|nr:hypothetical protein [Bradyrhizobium sp.]
MADSDSQEDAAKVASHTLPFLRSLDRKVDLVLETQARHTERLGRLERDVAEARRDLTETRRDLTEVRSDIALLENKTLSSQTEIVSILHRLEQTAAFSTEQSETAPPTPGGP